MRSVCTYMACLPVAGWLLTGSLKAQALQPPVAAAYYQPAAGGFLKENGQRRFNRALYGTNTAFRVEAGDLPEFALYLPGMGGTLRLGLQQGDSSKWLIHAKQVKAVYQPGAMQYEIHDPMLKNGSLAITVLPMAADEGMLMRITAQGVPGDTRLCVAYGGITGKKFSRDGDIGADPESSFYLQAPYCKGNVITTAGTRARLTYSGGKVIAAVFPAGTKLHVADAALQQTPAAFIRSAGSETPAVAGWMTLAGSQAKYIAIAKADTTVAAFADLAAAFAKAETQRNTLAQRIQVQTPDTYINTLGAALGMAADGIWENPTYLHGAVAWRMRLPAWRGPYVADPLGWHDRARTHFDSYALSQVTTPASGPVVADTALHLARQLEKMGTALFSSGYICRNPNGDFRPHHYDMNLVYIDALLRHFNWTGDTAYARKMWPVLQRHLAWEKRNFDMDNDGLYDAYCCIWASDALQYSGGAVTHSSAYNYFANRAAARLAALIGADAAPYQQEADRIYKAIQATLWMPDKGWYAEYKDALGDRLLHPAAALWSIYHAIDSKVPDAFQAYQSLRYIDTRIPHIVIPAPGIAGNKAYLLATTNWQPYSWSLNNVALAENLHTALAYWQGNRPDAAFALWRSALVESMYMGSSPGNFAQLSAYDAARGELYRDFADPVGMAARSLVEGLFGIMPDALQDTLYIHPGFPKVWSQAALRLPDVQFRFERKGAVAVYHVTPSFSKKLHLSLVVNADAAEVVAVTVNGKQVTWKPVMQVGQPAIRINVPAAAAYQVEIRWKGTAPDSLVYQGNAVVQQQVQWQTTAAQIREVYDPQQLLAHSSIQPGKLSATLRATTGEGTVFVLLRQGAMEWWQPVNLEIREQVSLVAPFRLQNNSKTVVQGKLLVNEGTLQAYSADMVLQGGAVTAAKTAIPSITGANSVRFVADGKVYLDTTVINWDVSLAGSTETVPLHQYFNDKVTQIFRNQYLSPRPATPTLQLPVQGIGDWCYPLVQATIDDNGLRKAAAGDVFTTPQGIRFATPSDSTQQNILFTSRWDNYPDKATVPLSGKASHVYLLMAGSTNAMQSQVPNGVITIKYKDGSSKALVLQNPGNWCPIEQDYLEQGAAFQLPVARPLRVYLKTGTVQKELPHYQVIKGYSNRAIDGGAATILDMVLDQQKELESLTLQTVANDVIIGLMSVSLVR